MMKVLIVVCSYHHNNTLKVANAIAYALQAKVVTPDQVSPDMLREYDLVGFGSGIYDAMHHLRLLKLANGLQVVEGRKAFLFSTDGTPRIGMIKSEVYHRKMFSDHLALRKKLETKGFTIVGDFNCAGFNTNSFLKLFGGLNKGRPNADDLMRASNFANELSSSAK